MPATKFAAPWLPKGEILLAEMPMRGKREALELAKLNSDFEALGTLINWLQFCQAVCGAHALIKATSVKQAKDAWDAYVLTNFDGGTMGYIWPEEQFAAAIKENLEGVVMKKTGTKDFEETMKVIDAEAGKAMERLKAFDQPTLKRTALANERVLYWRLRNSGVKQIVTAVGPIDLPWKADPSEDQDAIVDMLAQVVTQSDLEQLREKRTRPIDIAEDLLPKTAAEVEGKSQPSSTALTASRQSSTPSSASPMAPMTAS